FRSELSAIPLLPRSAVVAHLITRYVTPHWRARGRKARYGSAFIDERRTRTMLRAIAAAIALILGLVPLAALAQGDLIVQKKTFELPSYTTVAGVTIKGVKIGWEAAGTLNADKSNAILVTHFFSGTSHAFGKYSADDKVPGYWDSIIGPGKAIDTNKYYVISSDTLVNSTSICPMS